MQLIVFTGLPGTGKSTLAEAIGRELQIPVFAKDWLEAALRRSQLQPANETLTFGYVAYNLLTTLAECQLRLGQSVILDSVASVTPIRDQWRALAQKYAARWVVIECIWSDEAAHRAHLAERQRGIPGWHELEWSEVERVKLYYVPWNEERLLLDAANPIKENLTLAFAWLDSQAGNQEKIRGRSSYDSGG